MPSRIWEPLVCPLGRGNTPRRLITYPGKWPRLEPKHVCFQIRTFSSSRLPFPFISSTPAHPMTMAFASTFLCSQEIHGLASMADAHLFRREKSKDHILKALEALGPARL